MKMAVLGYSIILSIFYMGKFTSSNWSKIAMLG